MFCRGLGELLQEVPWASRTTGRSWIVSRLGLVGNDAAPFSSMEADVPAEESCQAGSPTEDNGSVDSRSQASAKDVDNSKEKANEQFSPTLPAGHIDFSKRELLMVFTCTRCNTRAAKGFSKKAYNEGVVIVQCPGCEGRHLIADNLGWFGEKGKTVEDFAKEKGHKIVTGACDGTLEITPDDIIGEQDATS